MTTEIAANSVADRADLAWELLRERKWEQAIVEFDRLLSDDATSEAGFQGKIACLRGLQRFSEAAALVAQALACRPERLGILSEKAWLAFDRNDFDGAIEDFRVALRRPQKDGALWIWLIFLLRRQSRFAEAEKAIVEARALFPAYIPLVTENGWLLFSQDRCEEASQIFAGVLSREAANEGALQGQVACARAGGQYVEAMRLAERARNLHPSSPGILSEIGWIEFEQGRFEEAEAAFKQIVDKAPGDANALLNLAWSLERQQDKESLARAALYGRRALDLKPTLAEARGCLGMVAFRQGHVRDAEVQFLESIAISPSEGHYADLGALYIHMGRYEEAEAILKAGMAKKNNDPALHLQFGNLYVQTDRLKQAIAEFRQALALDPKNPDAPRALAIALADSGKLAEAEIVLRTAIRSLDISKRWQLHLALSEVLSRMADDGGNAQLLDEALKEVGAALNLQPNRADPRFYAGIVRFKLEDYRGSQKAFEQCSQADETRVDAEINARRVRALIRQQKSQSRASATASRTVGILMAIQLLGLWYLRWRYGAGNDALVTTTMITVLVPVCLGLLVVSAVLPWLSKLKLTGLEAELSQPEPKQQFAAGPRGEIGFNHGSQIAGL